MSLASKILKLKNDQERWDWLVKNQDDRVIVNLDNDDTFITIEDNEDFLVSFDYYVGNSEGVETLLKSIGINAEPV